MEELFSNIEPSLSPAQEYINLSKDSDIHTWQKADQDGGDGEWIAYYASEIDKAFDMQWQGATELEAISGLNEMIGRSCFDAWKMEKY